MESPDSNAAHRARAGSETLSLDRVPIRTRESAFTSSAWRLRLRSAAGEGTIARIDGPSGPTLFRGDGVFLGWPQSDLAAEYERSRPPPEARESDCGQLG